ncbi:QacE family quaternary ammonium compound efflux SMR transporter [Paenibacillus sambharensis]|uniref:QacE family quaternary ammonium compound efflux SMR transporter n=1 Tax=Paenibacillus sambharensis TaxID=1803190 RepID=A0A2W1LRT7_9BACL|nr:multidrug efflux SMR transporter [Paenibacillus sambharensis]PZD94541.1 QacE family quaternary ammonium compound efflux SMR transporter [Paenibacillus sambharensis]
MLASVYLVVAILCEVFASSMLKLSNGFKKLYPSAGVVVGYILSFYLLSLALKALPLGTAYAIWAGLGTALTALIGVLVYKERFNAKKFAGMALIIAGVVIMNLTGVSH